MIKNKYLGQHIAILNGQLIDVDEDYGALYERIDAQYPDRFVWMAAVEDEPMPTLVFRSPDSLPYIFNMNQQATEKPQE